MTSWRFIIGEGGEVDDNNKVNFNQSIYIYVLFICIIYIIIYGLRKGIFVKIKIKILTLIVILIIK